MALKHRHNSFPNTTVMRRLGGDEIPLEALSLQFLLEDVVGAYQVNSSIRCESSNTRAPGCKAYDGVDH